MKHKVNIEYTNDELVYIVYNNRSLSNVINNFIPKLNVKELMSLSKIEKDFAYARNLYIEMEEMGLDITNIDTTAPDIKVTPEDVKQRKQLILDAHENLKGEELQYLKDRGFTDEIISKGKFGSMSYITNQEDIDILGISTHPIMHNVFENGVKGGGIVIPLFNKEDELVNVIFRKLSDHNKYKYTHTCSDVFVWGLDEIEKGDIVWYVEGILDKYVLESILPEGSKVISSSSASISPIQYMKIIHKQPSKINIICDNDHVGFRTGAIAQKVFHLSKIVCSTFYFDESKDVTEHILQNNGEIFDLIKINITKDFIYSKGTDFDARVSINFFDYLQNRKF